jgi:hypothetical protein
VTVVTDRRKDAARRRAPVAWSDTYRRNKIAHEADADPSSAGFRWPIDANLVNRATTFLVEQSAYIS